jgi:hypothetical protein
MRFKYILIVKVKLYASLCETKDTKAKLAPKQKISYEKKLILQLLNTQ